MTDLIDEVRRSFQTVTEATGEPTMTNGAVMSFETTDPDKIAPGLMAARVYYAEQTKMCLRRAYRKFAGKTLPDDSDECFRETGEVLGTLFTEMVLCAFCDGVQVGQGSSHVVQMKKFYDSLEEVFVNDTFRRDSQMMMLTFSAATDVQAFFVEFVMSSALALAHFAGFAHGHHMSHKIWDLWLISGSSMVTAAYIAGHQLGGIWSERDIVAEMEAQINDGSS